MKQQKWLVLVVLLCLAAFCLAACGEPAAEKVNLKILDTKYAEEDYCIAVSKENEELLNEINAAFDVLINGGSVQQVIDYYISGEGELPEVQQNVAADAEELRMGTNAEFPPYEYYEDEVVVGIDATVAGMIADILGRKLVIEDMAFESVIAAVQTGKVDMAMAGLTALPERMESVNFTTSYATGVQVVIVREDSEIQDVADLEKGGYVIGVQNATTGDLYSTWYLEDEGLATVERYSKGADAVAALVAGKVDCVIIDNEPAKAFVEANNQ